MAIADFIHSEAQPEGVAVKPKFIKILALAKHGWLGTRPQAERKSEGEGDGEKEDGDD
jgi:hypothetical protein